MKKIIFVGSILVSGLLVALLFYWNKKGFVSCSSIAGILLGFSLQWNSCTAQDLMDTTNWEVSQRKLKRGGYIKNNTIVRISFAYLFRIKIGSNYLLIKNSRGTGKYQPVGGVYKFKGAEKRILKNHFHIIDDDKISIDESSRDDYRLRMENRYLRKFVKRFDATTNRERIDNLSREFMEELIQTGIFDWKKITYRVCGRHMTELKFGEHFQTYELLLADIVELIPSEAQERDIQNLLAQHSDMIYFASAEEICSLGIDSDKGKLTETIADHTKKILQENEAELMQIDDVGKCFAIEMS